MKKSIQKTIQKMSDLPRHPQEKNGWNLMLAGFVILIMAGLALYVIPSGETDFKRIGNYLTGIGLAVYITGRIIRAKGRRLRERGEVK
jgi:type II secretory pathway component PulF